MTLRQGIELLKLRIAFVIALTAVTGYVAVAHEVRLGSTLALALAMVLGAGGSAAFNHVWDADIDRKMKRTRNRPLATGATSVTAALVLAAVLMGAGLTLAVAAFNWVVALHLFLGAFVYAVLYTVWLKRRTGLNIVIGGARAASRCWPAPRRSTRPWLLPTLLAVVLFLWTPSHFWSLAIFSSTTTAAGVPMLPVVIGPQRTAQCILANSLALVVASLLPWALGYLGRPYGVAAAALGAGLLGLNLRLLYDPSRKWAGWNFAASIPYLLGLFLAIVVDKHWG